MKICGIRRRPLLSTIVSFCSLSAIAAIAALSISGCGSGGTYNPNLKNNVPVVPNFTLAVVPTSTSVTQGNTANFTVTITETGGFNSPITLSASGLPTNATATFGAFAPTASGETAPLTITTTNIQDAAVVASKLAKPATTPAATKSTATTSSATREVPVSPVGSSTITITATGGGITQTANITLNVTAVQDFTITLAPATAGSNSIAPGGTAKFIATVTSIGGFSTPVALSLTGVPANTTATFGTTTITPTASGATTTLNLVTSFTEGAVTLPGEYPLTLTGTGGAITHTATSSIDVGVFSVTVTQATSGSGTVSQGQTAHYIVTLTSLDGFTPLVTLTPPALPTGAVATFGSNTVTPTASGASTTLTITTTAPGSSQTTPVGQLNFDVGASGGGYNTDGSAPLNVTNTPYYTITATPNPLTMSTASTGVYTITVTSVNGYINAVALSAAGLPANTSGNFTSQSITPTPAGSTTQFTVTAEGATPGTYPITFSGIGIGFSGQGSANLVLQNPQ